MQSGQELLLTDGLNDPICDQVPPFADQYDVPIFGQMVDSSWVQWTPTVQLETNGPSINDRPEDMINNVLSDGGGEWSNKTGGVLKCANVARSFVNEETCSLSSSPTTCSSIARADLENGNVIVCGSAGEVTNDPSLHETFGIQHEEHNVYKEEVTDNQKTIIWTEIATNKQDQLVQRLAWALSQVLTIVPGNIDARQMTEVYTSFYDIFVRLGLDNYRDILREASFSPLMAEHLTYHRSKSASYVYETEGRYSSADENYAR